jgi:exo-beta-1,3-glucanase (GH17 family)
MNANTRKRTRLANSRTQNESQAISTSSTSTSASTSSTSSSSTSSTSSSSSASSSGGQLEDLLNQPLKIGPYFQWGDIEREFDQPSGLKEIQKAKSFIHQVQSRLAEVERFSEEMDSSQV